MGRYAAWQGLCLCGVLLVSTQVGAQPAPAEPVLAAPEFLSPPLLHTDAGQREVQRLLRLLYEPADGETPEPEIKSDPYGSRSGISPAGANLGFETGTLEGWTTTGNVWEGSPIEGDTVTPRRPGQVSMHDGKFWVTTSRKVSTDA